MNDANGRLGGVGIGNALVDVIARGDDPFLDEHGVARGAMTLIDTARAAELYDAMPPSEEISGGSGANTAAGLAAMGVPTGYIGKVKDDQLGRIFSHDMRALGATFTGPMPSAAGMADETGRCLVLVSPDGERSMSTYLGVSVSLTPEDVDTGLCARAEWLYLEGYLFDLDAAKAAYAAAVGATRGAGGRVAFTLSDTFCVDRHRADMLALIRDHVDLLFANRLELLALYETDDLEAAIAAASGDCETVVTTLSADGAIAAGNGGRVAVPAERVDLVDTTGAGDLFASGFLAGQVAGRGLEASARMGCAAAASVISRIGARPPADALARLLPA